MRAFYLVALIVFLSIIITIAFQNTASVTVHLLGWETSQILAVIIGISYLLGMVTGWLVFDFIRRSIHGITAKKKPTSGL